MCGIFGIVQYKADSVPDKRQLTETAHLLHHRGPDNYGIYADVGIGLVHTRLSLLDLTPRGNQPFWDRQGRYGLVYNGEIYNFQELRATLKQCGVKFDTTSDTEVLLECLIHYGVEAALPQLEGMFAFGLYDKVEKTLVLARDRFGIKPLFIYDKEDTFIFASEIRAMRPWLAFTPDQLSISSFLYGFSGPTKGRTFFENIKFLEPGSVVKLRLGKRALYSKFFAITDFWNPEQAEHLKQCKLRELVDRADEFLLTSVKKQLIADAPVGALCSGGVDSSLIMAMAAQSHTNLAIFHANVVGPNSEYDAAMRLANHLKLDLHTVEVSDHDFIEQIPDVTEHYGHPFYECPHSVPFLMVSRLVRHHQVKAVLSGEGSDECYLGYSWLAPNVREWRRYTRNGLRSVVRQIKGRGGTLRVPQISQVELVKGLHNRFEVAVEACDIHDRVQGAQGSMVDAKNAASLELLNYNLRSLLHRNDAMGMAASIESRFPFLESELVQFAVNIPYIYKIRFSPTAFDKNHYLFRDKWLLRKVAERYLPRDLSQRSKKPFPVDAYKRFRIAPAYFAKSFIVDLFGLSSQELQYLIDHADNMLKLKLMQLDVWAHVCLNNLPKQSITNKLRKHIALAAN